MIGEIVKRFAPERGKVIVDAVNRLELTVKEGVEAVFGLLPSQQLPEIRAFAQSHVEIRTGFAQFVALCKHREWPITVVSGGFDFFVEHALQSFRADIAIYCNAVDTCGEYLKVRWNTPCDADCSGGCGLCKPSVIRATTNALHTPPSALRSGIRSVGPNASRDRIIVVGDGVTDLKAASIADYVFARDKLLAACIERGIRHTPFETFTDICLHLQNENAEVFHDG